MNVLLVSGPRVLPLRSAQIPGVRCELRGGDRSVQEACCELILQNGVIRAVYWNSCSFKAAASGVIDQFDCG